MTGDQHTPPPTADLRTIADVREALAPRGVDPQRIGIVVVDHGSRREESNRLLEQVALAFQQTMGWPLVEPAHMELAEPSLATAVARLVARGAESIVVHPYFLAPGRHWRHDIPALVQRAAEPFPQVRTMVTAPLGLHPLMLQIMQDRITYCLDYAEGQGDGCAVCQDEPACRWFVHAPPPSAT